MSTSARSSAREAAVPHFGAFPSRPAIALGPSEARIAKAIASRGWGRRDAPRAVESISVGPQLAIAPMILDAVGAPRFESFTCNTQTESFSEHDI